ncbi:hypothetical protein MLD38_030781 [Melastoma candidum]|uniref:Uncharacterized protein n=1 Tax=Melastoma candidum TaxID=119954 RepID=A0ACB9MNX2_9MYRT|nr:hypothetical protein MLD38_030781 [Melastoma candidum]
MGFLHKLWDETLAGPAPESGLGKLRKNLTIDTGSVPHSPVGSSGPGTPNTPGTPDGNGKIKKFTRKKQPNGSCPERKDTGGPTGYDWIVISALDR